MAESFINNVFKESWRKVGLPPLPAAAAAGFLRPLRLPLLSAADPRLG